MVLQSGLSDSDDLAFFDVLVLLIQNLHVPDLIRLVNHSTLARIFIELEHLKNFHLEVEIKVLVVLLDIFELTKVRDKFAGQHVIFIEAGMDPFPQVPQNFLLFQIEFQRFTKEVEWGEFLSTALLFHRGENGPRRVEENIGGKLFLILVFTHGGSVDSDNITNSL